MIKAADANVAEERRVRTAAAAAVAAAAEDWRMPWRAIFSRPYRAGGMSADSTRVSVSVCVNSPSTWSASIDRKLPEFSPDFFASTGTR